VFLSFHWQGWRYGVSIRFGGMKRQKMRDGANWHGKGIALQWNHTQG